MKSLAAFSLVIAAAAGGSLPCCARAAQNRTDEYALILQDPPLSKDGGRLSVRFLDVASKQTVLTAELLRRKLHVAGSVKLLLNAVFIQVSRGSHPDLRNLPNVKAVAWLPPLKRHLNTALGLVQVLGAWSNPAIGGESNAGAGIKIGIIDTGIDDGNPAFQDAALKVPAGYPLVSDPAFVGRHTNNKIIVARSYVSSLSSNDAQYSSPDDTSPIDRVGHGTAVAMIAAGETITGPAATITGVAPKAFLGNYKIFGSPGVNDFPTNMAFIMALEDAFNDGMDVVTAAVGGTASIAPLDDCPTVITSGDPGGSCDVAAYAVENAVESGMSVVVSAGDDGESGNVAPTLGTINSPGDAPSAITVGASTNLHTFANRVSAIVGDRIAITTLNPINGLFADTTRPAGPVNGPVIVAGGDETACTALPGGSLNGAIALVIRGGCDFDVKANNTQAAGAIAMILYLDNPSDTIFEPTGLADSFIPVMLVSNADGLTLKQNAGSGALTATLDPTLYAQPDTADQIAAFSSRGPSIGVFGTVPIYYVKPDLVAVGQDIYTATQVKDPNGNLYDPSGYTAAAGTSFAVPLVAGAVALVKQAHPLFTPAQLKSAIVGTATQNVTDGGVVAGVNAVGAGKLDAADALNVAVTCIPATVHFGVPNSVGFGSQSTTTLNITNVTNAPVAISVAVSQRTPDSAASVAVSPSSVSIPAQETATVTLSLTGQPNSGSYDGQINITGAGPALHVPYQYLVGDNNPAILFPIFGDGILNLPGSGSNYIGFRLLDQYGVPINTPVNWSVISGNGSISQSDPNTDQYGAAAAIVDFGTQTGTQVFEGSAGGLKWQFTEEAENAPSVSVYANAATFLPTVAAGSYIVITGSALATTSSPYLKTSYLPLSLATTTVTFDANGISVPAPLSYISPNQVNAQIPWELAGQTSAVMKVTRNNLVSATETVSLSAYAPGIFEYHDLHNGQLIAAAEDVNYQLVDSSNPIPRGQDLILYANGLGPVTAAQTTGYAASANPIAYTAATPTVTIGGQAATVLFSGLSAGSVSLNQLNVTVSPNTPTGLQPVVVTISGVSSQTSHVYVQ